MRGLGTARRRVALSPFVLNVWRIRKLNTSLLTYRNVVGARANGITSRSLREAVQAVFQSKTGYVHSSAIARPQSPHLRCCFVCFSNPLPGIPPSVSDAEIRVHLTSPAVLTSHLAALELAGLDAVKAVLPLPFSSLAGIGADGAQLSELTDEERRLYELLRDEPAGSLEDLDGGVRPVPELMSPDASHLSHALVVDSQDSDVSHSPVLNATSTGPVPSIAPASPALVVLAVSALISLLVVACVSVSILTLSYFRKHVLRSDVIPWDVVPRIENGLNSGSAGGSVNTCVRESPNDKGAEKDLDLIDFDGPVTTVPPSCVDLAPDLPPEYSEKTGLLEVEKDGGAQIDGDLNEKSAFQDAPLLFTTDSLPAAPRLSVVITDASEGMAHADPELLPLPASPTRSPRVEPLAVPPSLKRLPSQTQMRERDAAGASPISRPAWSVRAAASPALGLPASAAHTPSTPLPFTALPSRTPSPPMMPGALFSEAEADAQQQEMAEVARPGRGRAYRAPMPELDIAFALQLRPGLGLGAEGAWLVRFLMAMFGWLGVVVGGGATGAGVARERRAAIA